jgi:hypothetical protein
VAAYGRDADDLEIGVRSPARRSRSGGRRHCPPTAAAICGTRPPASAVRPAHGEAVLRTNCRAVAKLVAEWRELLQRWAREGAALLDAGPRRLITGAADGFDESGVSSSNSSGALTSLGLIRRAESRQI